MHRNFASLLARRDFQASLYEPQNQSHRFPDVVLESGASRPCR